AFDSLPLASKYLKVAGLVLLLVSITLIMSPGAYHRIVWQGNDSPDIQDFTTSVMDLALLPILLTLGIDFYAIVGKFAGTTGGILAGGLIATTALLCWYGPALIGRKQKSRPKKKTKQSAEMEHTPLK